MRIIERIKAKAAAVHETAAVTVAFLGDSVTQGCFECYVGEGGNVFPIYDYESAYSTHLKKLLNTLYPSVQFNMINAGISGDNASGGIKRLDRDVLAFKPDLVVVGYALNDAVQGGRDGVEKYAATMREIVERVISSGAECIVLTPNMMNTYTSAQLKEEIFVGIAEKCAAIQNGGILDLYAETARTVAAECGAVVCDVYSKWLAMYRAGVDVTELLSNKLNHPPRSLHKMISMMLLECILEK